MIANNYWCYDGSCDESVQCGCDNIVYKNDKLLPRLGCIVITPSWKSTEPSEGLMVCLSASNGNSKATILNFQQLCLFQRVSKYITISVFTTSSLYSLITYICIFLTFSHKLSRFFRTLSIFSYLIISLSAIFYSKQSSSILWLVIIIISRFHSCLLAWNALECKCRWPKKKWKFFSSGFCAEYRDNVDFRYLIRFLLLVFNKLIIQKQKAGIVKWF